MATTPITVRLHRLLRTRGTRILIERHKDKYEFLHAAWWEEMQREGVERIPAYNRAVSRAGADLRTMFPEEWKQVRKEIRPSIERELGWYNQRKVNEDNAQVARKVESSVRNLEDVALLLTEDQCARVLRALERLKAEGERDAQEIP